MTHTCIRPGCSQTYESDEVDAYYCPSCVLRNKSIADTLTRQHQTVGQEPRGLLQEYDAATKVGGFMRVKL